jgi:EAL domain-containing protein (putative c-di-GMP-specific phosphodiesterase class I)
LAESLKLCKTIQFRINSLIADRKEEYAQAQEMLANLLALARQSGITVNIETIVRTEYLDLLAYKAKYDANLLIT